MPLLIDFLHNPLLQLIKIYLYQWLVNEFIVNFYSNH